MAMSESDAKIAIQLGHAGRKGATKVLWEGYDELLLKLAADLDAETWLRAEAVLGLAPAAGALSIARPCHRRSTSRIRTQNAICATCRIRHRIGTSPWQYRTRSDSA